MTLLKLPGVKTGWLVSGPTAARLTTIASLLPGGQQLQASPMERQACCVSLV